MNENVSLVVRAVDKATAPLRKIGVAFAAMSKKAKDNLRAVGTTATVIGGAIGAAGVGGAILSYREAGETESALGHLAAVGVKSLGLLRHAARGVSNEIAGVTRVQFLDTARKVKRDFNELAGSAISDMTKIQTWTAVALGKQPLEAAGLFKSAVRLFQGQFKKLGSVGVAEKVAGGLFHVYKAFGADAETVQRGLERTGEKARGANVPMAEQLTIIGMLQRTMGSRGVMAFSSYLESAAKAGEKLGLPFLDANRRLRSTAEILEVVRKQYGDTLDEAEKRKLREAFGNQGFAFIEKFIGQEATLRKEIKRTNQAINDGMAGVRKGADAINDGPNESIDKLHQSVANLADVFGSTITGYLKPAVDWLRGVVVSVQAWTAANPELAATLYTVVTILGLVVAGLGAASLAMLAFNGAVWANPTVWIVAGIVAALVLLGGTIWWLANHWDQAVAFVSDLFWGLVDLLADIAVKLFWPWIMAGLVLYRAWLALWGMLKGPLTSFGAWLAGIFSRLWDHIVNSASEFGTRLWAALKELAGGILDIFAANPFVQAGANLVSGIWEGIKSSWGQLAAWVSTQVDNLVGWMPDWMKTRLGLGGPGQSAGGPTPVDPAAARPNAGQHNRLTARVEVDVKGPPGTRLRRAETNGDADVDLFAGLTNIGT